MGSLFIYASLDGDKFAIKKDSWEMLFASALPDTKLSVCPGMERQGSSNSDGISNVTLSISERIDDLDSQSFHNMVENFIDVVLTSANRLCVCAAERYSLQKLYLLSNGENIDRVLLCIKEFSIDPIHSPILDAGDLALFKKSLSPNVEAVGRVVNKKMSVSSNGQFAFTYENLTICVEPTSSQTMLLTAALWKTNEDGPITEEVLRQALELNYLQQQTRGGMISMYSSSGNRNELFFMYEDSVNINSVSFRNILENFIDPSLELYERIRQSPQPLQQAYEDLERDLRQRQATIIEQTRNGDFSIVERIFALGDPSLIKEKLDSLTFTVMDTRDMELWRCMISIIFRLATIHQGMDVEGLRKSVFRRVFEKDMFDDDLLRCIVDGAPDNFELENLSAVFSSSKLLQDRRVASTAQELVDLHHSRYIKTNNKSPVQIIVNWGNLASNILSSSTRSDHAEVIACLDWAFSNTKPGELYAGTGATSLLHNTASLGLVEVVKFLLERLPHIRLDEETLLWACKQNHKDLAVYIISDMDDLPCSKAIMATAACGGVEILKALKVGITEGIPLDGINNNEDISRAIAMAAEAAISNGNWPFLKHILTDKRIKAPLGGFLRHASLCTSPKKAMTILVSSRYGARRAFSCCIPWQAQSFVLDLHVMMHLRVMVKCNIPSEVGSVVWSFLRPNCKTSPTISHSHNFLESYQKLLERDLGIGQITHCDDGTFELPDIGRLSFQNGLCCLKKRFDTSEIHITPEIPLGMSLQLGGCFLSARDLGSALWLRRNIQTNNFLNYNELRLLLRSFKKTTKIVEDVLSDAKKLNFMVPAHNLSVFAPNINAMNKIRSASKIREDGHSFSLSYFTNSKLAQIATPCHGHSQNTKSLLEANMLSNSDETFFCIDANGAVSVAAYVHPNKIDNRILKKLVKKVHSCSLRR